MSNEPKELEELRERVEELEEEVDVLKAEIRKLTDIVDDNSSRLSMAEVKTIDSF